MVALIDCFLSAELASLLPLGPHHFVSAWHARKVGQSGCPTVYVFDINFADFTPLICPVFSSALQLNTAVCVAEALQTIHVFGNIIIEQHTSLLCWLQGV